MRTTQPSGLPIRRVLVTEWRLLLRDGGAVTAVTALTGLLTFALWSGQQDLAASQAAYQAVLRQEREQELSAARQAAEGERQLAGRSISSVTRYVEHGPTHPQWLGSTWSFRVAAMPPPPLSLLAKGQLDVTPTVYRVRTNRLTDQHRLGESTAHPRALVSGRVDPTMIVLVFVPLLVIVLGADLVAGERERGTWALLRAQPQSAAALAATRAAFRLGLSVVPLLVTGASVYLIVPAADDHIGARLAVWLGGTVAYLGVWWGAALLATATSRTTSVALTRLLVAWGCSVFLVPTGIRYVIEARAPVPHRAVQIQQERLGKAGSDRAPAEQVLAHYLTQFPDLSARYRSLLPTVSDVEFASGPYYLMADARDLAAADVVRPILTQIDEARLRQDRLARHLSLLSPSSLAQVVLVDAAGTDSKSMHAFRVAVERFHDRWRAFMLPKLFEITPIGAKDYADLPVFSYAPPALEGGVAKALLRILGLATWGCALTAWALRRLGRPEA